MNFSSLSKSDLLNKCTELGVKCAKSKTKPEIISLLESHVASLSVPERQEDDGDEYDSDSETDSIPENTPNISDLTIDVNMESDSVINAKLENIRNQSYKFIDLFCGIGGFHQALYKLGGKCVLACDIDKDCRQVYKDNYGIEPVSNVKDIDENTMEDFDILCAGFPCFVAGTQTLTDSGYKNIEHVVLTDKLMTHTGKYQNILNLQRKSYTGKLYEFNLKYHPELITCTEEHPFYVREKTRKWNTETNKYDYSFGEPMWKPASQITMHDYFGMVINNPEFIDSNSNTQEFLTQNIKEFINLFLKDSSFDGELKMDFKEWAYDLQRLYLKLGRIFSITNVNDLNYSYIMKEEESSEFAFIEGNYVWYAPFEITTRETTDTLVYNFEVETDNSYIVQNVCVHNCQAFSNGGKKKCFDDERGLLFDEIVRIAKVKQPKFMFLENVKHILKVSNGQVIEYIKNKIDSIGYKLQLFQMSPHNYGIPQQRERVYFICVRNDIYNEKDVELPLYVGGMNFHKFLDKKEEIDEKYFLKGDVLNVLEAWDKMVRKFEVGEKISPTIMINDAYRQYSDAEFDAFPSWKRDYITKNKPLLEKYKRDFDLWYSQNSELLQKREIYGKLEWQTGLIKDNDSIFNHFIQIRQSGIRVKKGHYFPTLVAISQIPIYGREKRYITPRECARLQSFPESFKLPKEDRKSYKQMGNSVNVDNVLTVIRSTLLHYES